MFNFVLNQSLLCEQFEAMWASSSCGVQPALEPETIVIDYSSPNLAKEMHVGHLRSTIIGDALARIFELQGKRVIRQNHVGDWGTQFGMLLAHLEEVEHTKQQDIELQNLESFYKAAKRRFDEDIDFANKARHMVVKLQSGDAYCLSLWKRFILLSQAHCQAIYERLGVSLTPEDIRAESAYNVDLPQVVASLRALNLLVESEGAQCVFLDEFRGKDQKPLPIIVQKKDGGFLYASTDLAAVRYRQQVLHASRVLYVVDARQALHFQQIFSLAYKAGFAKPSMQLEHVGFGMVLDKAGKPFKSRDGGVTKLADLLDEAVRRAEVLIASKQPTLDADALRTMATVVGMASIKYADLSKNRISDYVFDWDTMLSFEGNTAPYLLYAYTRVNSLFLKAGLSPSALALLGQPLVLQDTYDVALAKHLVLFPEMIELAASKAAPHGVCTYLYELASLFSSFYEACPILNQSDEALKASRLKLAGLTARVLEQGLSLLGIGTLTRM